MLRFTKHIIFWVLLALATDATLHAQVLPPIVQDTSLCSSTRDSVKLYAKPASNLLDEKIIWYTNAVTTVPYAITDSNLTVFDTATVTYYAATLLPGDTTVYDTFVYSNPIENVNAQPYSYYFDGQVFDVIEPVVLESVVMYFNNMFNVVVVIKDNLGNIVNTTNVPNPTGLLDGQEEVFLNARLLPGIGYTITAEGSGGNGLLRNFSGAVYPYSAIDQVTSTPVLSVTGTINGLTDYLYFFYDWKVLQISNDSVSARLPVTTYVNTQPILGFFSRKVCQDTVITLDATVNAVNPTYFWPKGQQTTPQIQVSNRDIFIVEVTIPVPGFADCIRQDTVQVDTFARTFITILDTSYVSCAGDVADNIDIKLSGGRLPYDVYWTDENGNSVSTELGTFDSLHSLINTPYGSYTVLVQDDNNCKSTLDSITITEPEPLDIQLNYLDSIICNGEPTGRLETVLSGGRLPYVYDWSTASGTMLDSNLTSTIDTFSELSPDVYVLSLTDNNGCALSDTIAINFIAGSVPLNYDSERNTSFGANSELWSAFVIYDANKLTPYYETHFIEYVSAYISDEDTNIVEAILRVRKDVTDTQRPFIAGSHWTKVYEDNVTSQLKGINGFKCVKLVGAPLVLETGRKYIIEIEFLLKDGTVQILGLDAGVQPDPNGAFLFNLSNPNGVALSSLGAFNRNWNMRLTLRDVNLVGEADLPVGNVGGLVSYPNPANEQVNFSFQLPKAGQVSLKVFDLQGKEIASLINEQLTLNNSQFITWNIQEVPAGMYIGVLQTEEGLFTTKLLIVR